MTTSLLVHMALPLKLISSVDVDVEINMKVKFGTSTKLKMEVFVEVSLSTLPSTLVPSIAQLTTQ